MRTALELHKEVLQGLQTVDAFSQNMFLPEEIDFHLNKQQDSFVNELFDKGFADRQLRLDYTQDLIIKNKPLSVFISPSAYYYEQGAVNSYLPGDYRHLLSARAKVSELANCATIDTTTEGYLVDYTQMLLFQQLNTTRTVSPYYSKVELVKINENQTENILASVSLPVEEKEDTYMIIKNLIYQANKVSNDSEFHWEKYSDGLQQGLIKQNQIIIRDDSVTTPSNTWGYVIRVYNDDGSPDTTVYQSYQPITVSVWGSTLLDLLQNAQYRLCDNLDNKELYERRRSPFYLTKKEKPLINISNNLLFAYYTNKFVIENLTIDYIREPQPISIVNNQGCELAGEAGRIIADRTVEYLKLAIENPNYREVLGHNVIREQS